MSDTPRTISRMETTNDDPRQPMLTNLAYDVESAPGPLEQLEAVRALTDGVVWFERTAVAQARESGASWAEVGARLGVSKQAAQKRFAPKPDRVDTPDVPTEPAEPKQRTQPSWEVTTRKGRTLLRIRKSR